MLRAVSCMPTATPSKRPSFAVRALLLPRGFLLSSSPVPLGNHTGSFSQRHHLVRPRFLVNSAHGGGKTMSTALSRAVIFPPHSDKTVPWFFVAGVLVFFALEGERVRSYFSFNIEDLTRKAAAVAMVPRLGILALQELAFSLNEAHEIQSACALDPAPVSCRVQSFYFFVLVMCRAYRRNSKPKPTHKALPTNHAANLSKMTRPF